MKLGKKQDDSNLQTVMRPLPKRLEIHLKNIIHDTAVLFS